MGSFFSKLLGEEVVDLDEKELFKNYYGIYSSQLGKYEISKTPQSILSNSSKFRDNWPFIYPKYYFLAAALLSGVRVASVYKKFYVIRNPGITFGLYIGTNIPTLLFYFFGQEALVYMNPILSTSLGEYLQNFRQVIDNNFDEKGFTVQMNICPLCYQLRAFVLQFGCSTVIPLLSCVLLCASMSRTNKIYKTQSFLGNLKQMYKSYINEPLASNPINTKLEPIKSPFEFLNKYKYFWGSCVINSIAAMYTTKIQMDKSLRLTFDTNSPYNVLRTNKIYIHS